MNELTQKNAELGRFLFCERYTLQPMKNSLFIAEGQDLKRGAVVDVNGVLVGTNSLMPYAVLENDCDTRARGAFASVFVKGEFNFDKLFFAEGLSKEDLDNIVYNGSGIGLVIKPYDYTKGFSPLFSPSMFPAGTSQSNPLMNAAETERMILKFTPVEANTLRFDFSKNDYDPTIDGIGSGGTWKKVSKYANIWDWTKSGNSFADAFGDAFADYRNKVNLIAAGDTSSVTDVSGMFFGCLSLESVVPFDTSSVTNMFVMFSGCEMLKSVPIFDTSSVTNMERTFEYCSFVSSGALALYQQASTQATPPTKHKNTFIECGSYTTTGAAELAQIPASWGGTAAG